MKIDSSLKPSAPGPASGSRARTPKAEAGAGSSSAAEVRLSSASAQLSGAGNDAPVDSSRVAEIKQAIAEGRFSINADAIAAGVLQTARDLVGKRGQG